MKFDRITRRFTAWLACLAILMTVIAPGISQAIAYAGGSGSVWAEICSNDGAKLVRFDGRQKQGKSEQQHSAFNHCPYCSVQAHSPVIPDLTGFSVPRCSANFACPRFYFQSFSPAFFWVTSQPRAPPPLS